MSADVANHPLPAANDAMQCLRVFLKRFNNMFSFFQDHEIMTVFQKHVHGALPLRPGWYAAVSTVCACALWATEGAQNTASEQLFQNALRLLPDVLTEAPGAVSIGALLLLVTYLVSTSRCSTAAMVLGSAAQMILLAGYHTTVSDPGHESAQDLHTSRLLYIAYILEQDLSLRLGKPPILNQSMITCLPSPHLEDSQGIMCSSEGTTVNYLRERVALARIQNEAWNSLRSPLSSTKSSREYLESTNQLLRELQAWEESMPASIRPPEVPAEPGDPQQMRVAEIHWSYFQTVVAIHSAVFSHPSLFRDPAVRDQAAVAVGECAGAVRGMLALAKRPGREHLLVPCSLSQVGWNMDGLLLYVMLNRRSPRAQEDIRLFESMLEHFEKPDSQHEGDVAAGAVAIMYKVAKEAVSQA